jgi:hypoxanthine phosphoribosyltransferase
MTTGEKTTRPEGGPAPPPFAHPSEAEFARILDFYGVRWLYEPHSFPIRWEGGEVVEMFTPDFYLPDLDLYIELTTMKQSLVREKNRKIRLLRTLYPHIKVKLLYRKDYHRLLARYGFGPLASIDSPGLDRVLLSAEAIRKRVRELGHQISQDYQGKEPVLVGVLRGVLCFMADLLRSITLPVSVDFMSISPFGQGEGVRITKDLDLDIREKDVLLVEDIVDTGMTLHFLLRYLETRGPASLRVCALLDKRVRRIAEVPLHYVGFEVPDEFLVGYGLDYREKYRNLPFIGVLKTQV